MCVCHKDEGREAGSTAKPASSARPPNQSKAPTPQPQTADAKNHSAPSKRNKHTGCHMQTPTPHPKLHPTPQLLTPTHTPPPAETFTHPSPPAWVHDAAAVEAVPPEAARPPGAPPQPHPPSDPHAWICVEIYGTGRRVVCEGDAHVWALVYKFVGAWNWLHGGCIEWPNLLLGVTAVVWVQHVPVAVLKEISAVLSTSLCCSS